MSEALYKATASAGAGPQGGGPTDGAGGAAGGQPADDDAIDAEFEVKS
jgi:hypothetical protein